MPLPVRFLVVLIGSFLAAPFARSQSIISAIHLINDSGVRADDSLSDSGVFLTNFKGVGDVTITELAGGPEQDFVDDFNDPNPGNNPSYIRNYVGADSNGTGDGTPGGLTFLHFDANEPNTSWQFDFAIPLTASDRLAFADVDINEQYQVQAFTRLPDGSYQPLDLGGWRALNFSGMTGILPDATWAAWDPASGTLTADNDGLEEPLNILAPDQPVDRLIVTKIRGDGASAGFQIISLPTEYVPAVTLSVVKSTVVNGTGSFGEFLVSIDEPPTSNLFVNYIVKGSALNGTDYLFLKGTKKIKPGKTSKPIKIFPSGDLEGAAKKVVKMTLATGDGYVVGTTGPLKVKIVAGQ